MSDSTTSPGITFHRNTSTAEENGRRSLPDGFTLIELLVVIAIIGLLSSVVLASLSGARESARVTRLISDFEQIETGLILWMDRTGQVTFPTEQQASGGIENPSINDVRAHTTLDQYLNNVPAPSFVEDGGLNHYVYDNDGDVFTCGAFEANGMNIFIDNQFDDEIANRVDEIVDGGNGLSCGKIRRDVNDTLIYSISNDGVL